MAVMQFQNMIHLDRRSAVSNQGYGKKPVYPSGPSTGCEPTPLVTDGRRPSACPPNSYIYSFPPSPSKTGTEFEAGSLISAAGAVPLTSLDSKENNRDSPHDAHRINQCGKFTLRGAKPGSKVLQATVQVLGMSPLRAAESEALSSPHSTSRGTLQAAHHAHSDARSEEAQWERLYAIHQ